MQAQRQWEFDQLEAGGRGQSPWRLVSERETGREEASGKASRSQPEERGGLLPDSKQGMEWPYFLFYKLTLSAVQSKLERRQSGQEKGRWEDPGCQRRAAWTRGLGIRRDSRIGTTSNSVDVEGRGLCDWEGREGVSHLY